jgi:hypothetical protein
MPQSRQTKPYHTFVGGLNTEVSPLVYPDNTALDLSNMELHIDGSISRRKALEAETAATATAVTGFTVGTDATTEHFWRNAGGGDSHFHVVQMGYTLYYFLDDPTTLVARASTTDLRTFKPSAAAWTDAQVASEPVDISWGRGQALCTGKYIDPFYLVYDEDADTITGTAIQVRIRDFVGADDAVSDNIKPASLTDSHSYNLQNQGWTGANIEQYNTDESEYPSKNQVHHQAFLRTLTASTGYDDDGVKSYSSTKLASELFGDAPAKNGHFIIDAFCPSAGTIQGPIDITSWTFPGGETPGTAATLRMTVPTGHGIVATDTVVVSGQEALADEDDAPGTQSEFSWFFNGNYTVDATTATTIDITSTLTSQWAEWTFQAYRTGEIALSIENPEDVSTTLRPTTNAYFAARAWYAGTPAGTLGQAVFFSQIIQHNRQYGKCYQTNDPTNQAVPDLLESDGGVIFIPEAGRITKLQPFGQSMLVMCENGVWEIDGGSNRYFDAIDYTVRRVTGAGCVSQEAVLEAEANIIYASQEGAFRIFTDPEARVLVADNFTEDKVQTKWTNIDHEHKKAMKTIYDPLRKRIMFMYDTIASPTAPTWNYQEVLIYDAKLTAWFPYTFPPATDFATSTYVKGFVTPDIYTRAGETIIKYLTYTTAGMLWTEMTENTAFTDLGEVDAAGYLITGYDGMGDHSKDKQVRYMTTFMERIEDASLSHRGRWDFADSGVSGKWSPSIESYRPPRMWIGAHDADGYPVVVSKHTIPGQGQVLSLRYDTTAGADAKLYGWTIDFQGIQD